MGKIGDSIVNGISILCGMALANFGNQKHYQVLYSDSNKIVSVEKRSIFPFIQEYNQLEIRDSRDNLIEKMFDADLNGVIGNHPEDYYRVFLPAGSEFTYRIDSSKGVPSDSMKIILEKASIEYNEIKKSLVTRGEKK